MVAVDSPPGLLAVMLYNAVADVVVGIPLITPLEPELSLRRDRNFRLHKFEPRRRRLVGSNLGQRFHVPRQRHYRRLR